MVGLPERTFVVGLGRAAGGALLFAVPMLMTNEMWALGFHIDPGRLALLLLATPILLFGLAHYIGFRETDRPKDHIADAMVAIAMSALGASALLAILGLLAPGMSAREIVGKVGLQVVPASIGAMLARTHFGAGSAREKSRRLSRPDYFLELFLMAVGALVLALSIAPTEEVVAIAHLIPPLQELALLVVTICVMHTIVYYVEFKGRVPIMPHLGPIAILLRFTVVGYVIVFMVSIALLWVFGRIEGLSVGEILSAAIVLSFPGAIGAAAARLVL